MNWLDAIIIISVFGYVWGGFWTGLIQSIGGLVGLFLGGIVASRGYDGFGNSLEPLFGGNGVLADIFAFILLFMLVTRLVGLAFYLVNKMFNFFAILPGMKMMNRMGGAIFGFLEGALFIGITLQFMSHLPLSIGLTETVAESRIAGYFLMVAAWLVPLFPPALKEAENVVDKFLPK